jgi:hypothetical protein
LPSDAPSPAYYDPPADADPPCHCARSILRKRLYRECDDAMGDVDEARLDTALDELMDCAKWGWCKLCGGRE